MLFGHRRREIRLMSQVSYLKSHISCHRLILFSSLVITDEIDPKRNDEKQLSAGG
jgi:hypothetical protein